jgi:hypothetical protein
MGLTKKIVLLINVIKMCPAVILAANRIDSVIGRITCLTLSIKTIKCDNDIGVPVGTRCVKNLSKEFLILNRIKQNQKGKANPNVNIICAVIL